MKLYAHYQILYNTFVFFALLAITKIDLCSTDQNVNFEDNSLTQNEISSNQEELEIEVENNEENTIQVETDVVKRQKDKVGDLGLIFGQLDWNERQQLPQYGLFQKCNWTTEWGSFEVIYVPVPLQNIKIKSSLYSTLLTTSIFQSYTNVEKVPVEIQYVFPVDAESVIYNLTVHISDNTTIVGEIMETAKAKEAYDQAIKEGNTAYMAQYDTDSAQDKVVLMIGNLQPGVNVTVVFQVATQIKPTIKGDWRIVIPAALTPKFPTELALNQSTKYKLESATYFETWWNVPYSIDFSLEIISLSAIKNIRCASHEIVYSPKGENGALIGLNPLKSYQPDRDLIILFQNEEYNKARVLVGKENTFYSTVLSFYPSIQSEKKYQQEFILVLDRSGSMEGERMELAKTTAILFVQSLPFGCKFNIISFGSFYEKMWERSVLYNDETRKYAVNQVQGFYANMGGTEILEPLQEVYSWGVGEIPKTIFLVTDGGVSNPDAVIQLIAQNSDQMGIRVHAFGIGAGVSTYLVINAAEAGKGTYSFVQENEPVDDKVVSAMEIALQPYLTDFDIKWAMKNKEGQVFGTESSNLLQSPKFIKFLLNKEITFIYALIMDDSFVSGDVSISYQQEGKSQKIEMEIYGESAIQNTGITKLAARNLIKELEKNKTENKDMIIYLSTKFGVLSSLTSFIAIQEVYNPVNETMERRNIPIATTQDYGYKYDYVSLGFKTYNCQILSRTINFAVVTEDIIEKFVIEDSDAMEEDSDQIIQYDISPQDVQKETEVEEQSNPQVHQGYIALVYHQQADGSFLLSQELTAQLGYQLDEIYQAIPQFIENNNQKQDIFATVLVLTQLQLKFEKQNSSWKLVARKGQDWLISTGLSSDDLDKLYEFSRIFLKKENQEL